jgi:NADPH:quinone reductase-like Zn-dependent oxidoreductase
MLAYGVSMRAIVHQRYGSADLLELREVDKPTVEVDQVLVRVHAASVNPADWHVMTGTPYLGRVQMGVRRPRSEVLGTDFAGTVEAVGENVTEFKAGDEVFGARTGAFADYLPVGQERAVALKPHNLTFEEAAAVPIAGFTALQGLRDKGRIRAGHEVLINGASGGVGTFAVQIAKSFGATVTGVCSTRNVDIVRSLGADEVVDYTRDDITRIGRRFDLIFDIAGNHSLRACRRMLKPTGTYVLVGAPKGRWVRPVPRLLNAVALSLVGRRRMVGFLAKANKNDLLALKELLEAGKLRPVIDRRYTLSEIPEALRYVGEGHSQGKNVVTV